MRMENSAYDNAMTRSKQELARQLVEANAMLETIRNDIIEECARALQTQESSYLTASEAAAIIRALKEKS